MKTADQVAARVLKEAFGMRRGHVGYDDFKAALVRAIKRDREELATAIGTWIGIAAKNGVAV